MLANHAGGARRHEPARLQTQRRKDEIALPCSNPVNCDTVHKTPEIGQNPEGGAVVKFQRFVLAAIFLLIAVAGCASNAVTGHGPSIDPEAHAVDTYHIGVDDLLQVSVWRNPDLSVEVPVRPDGMISVPLIGDVEAGGHTPEEVAAAIEEQLATFIRDPQVAVILTQLRSHEYLSRVRITGAVNHPVSLPYRQGMTVLDAVLAAGGVTEFAAADNTTLYHENEQGVTTAYRVRLQDILEEGELATNYPVQPGDVITVPERTF